MRWFTSCRLDPGQGFTSGADGFSPAPMWSPPGMTRCSSHTYPISGLQPDIWQADEGTIPHRLGRWRLVMFPSGRTFLTECASVVESLDGTQDVALVALGAELDVNCPIPTHTRTSKRNSFDSPFAPSHGKVSCLPAFSLTVSSPRRAARVHDNAGLVPGGILPVAVVGDAPVEKGGQLFCVGNPSNVDLESLHEGGIEFEPPTWHASVGECEGYQDLDVAADAHQQSQRGRAPTRGEKKRLQEALPVSAEAGGYLMHSCWTYWGHSGAPLFDAAGKVAGLHCAWDDSNGMRHGQKLQHILLAIEAADAPAPEEATRRPAQATKALPGRKKKKKR